ncbi:imidazolonepropionase HutI [Phaeobacter piscinae]|uniref:Imidazolonepropionase n=1 Tax=Phaeobacter piscinae TaxID=1580596 RepID=A0ABN5DJK4_9RHOB|nr:imidazolonepropionase [Phaeobacter piscinae]ATG37540.1 imidazolonepropionase HutI [Phaeobacter piscinae]AUQ88061.1 imidazolonepropionase HutI [Phaeobacter piscinae]AUR25944.1 imidazolonepropionase HutI [Phaeobacter piscinae]
MDSPHSYLICDATLATMAGSDPAYGLIPGGLIVVQDGWIRWSGPEAQLPKDYADWPRVSMGGRLITPGLIDCHTHIVFGGNRAMEFEMRLNGASYEEVARAGGGIVSTVSATREASLELLVQGALPRLDALIAEGASVVEVKSGYGLDRETELNMLRAARRLGELRPVTVKTTFLGAHATPAEYKTRDDAYIDEVCIPALRAAHAEGLVDAVDGFCENIAFAPAQIERVFKVAQELGLPVKLHAEQLSHQGGTALAAQYGALSVDHVEYATEDDARAMAASGSVAVILPGAFYTIRETQAPPIEHFRSHGVPMALATDCNPGSSPLSSLLLTMNMGCTLFRMTPEEVLAGVTCNAARALGLTDRGQISADMRADLAVWDVETPGELAYRIGFNPLYTRIYEGKQ